MPPMLPTTPMYPIARVRTLACSTTRLIVTLTIALTAGSALVQAAPATAQRPSRQYTIEQFIATTSLRDASFSSKEDKILYSSNESGIFNVYSMPVAGGQPTQITKSTTDTTYAVSYFPDDDRVLYTRDQGGNELNHLYVMELDGKERDLTPGEKLKTVFHGWSRDGKAFYCEINDRNPKYFDVYRFDAASYERKLLFKNESGYSLGDVSGDEKWIAFQKTEGSANDDIYLLNVASGEMKLVTKHEGQKQYRPAEFGPDSEWLYYLTNDGSEFTRARRYNLATGVHEDVEKADWDIAITRFSHHGKYRLTAINADGTTVVKMYDTKTGATVPLPKLPDGEITSVALARSEKKLAFYVNGDRSPSNLYVFTLGQPSAVRMTNSLNKEIDAEDLVEAEVVRFKSFDGTVIPNIYYKPHQATPASKAPALVLVHGGPGGQTRRGYSALVQYLVNHGYVVLGINNRGSSGYGQSFYLADDRKHGREPLWDCVEAKKYLATLPYVDGGRIGIIGGSYGGYMVLAALAFQPDVFNVGVDIFGVANWVRTLESIPPYWEAARLALYQELGDPVKDKQMLTDISPLFHADKIRKPLMVLQGANDPRVIKPESDDIVDAIRKNGLPVEYVVFADEGHGFTKKKNQIDGYGQVLKFLDKYLKGSPPATMVGGV